MRRHTKWFGVGAFALSVGTVFAVTGVASADTSAPALLAFTRPGTDVSPATRIAAVAGTDSTGVYLDNDGHVNIAVTSKAAADQVRRQGGIPRMVTRSMTQLHQATTTLDQSLKVGGTAWYVDPRSDQVVVEADGTVTDANLAKVQAAVAKLGSAARLTRSNGKIGLTMSAGDAINAPVGHDNLVTLCSAGFNVQANGGTTKYMLSAGHCLTDTNQVWQTEKTKELFGITYRKNLGNGQDFGAIQYLLNTTVVHNGDVDLYNGQHQDITRAGNAVAGMYVERTGATSGFHDGHVIATDATVTPDGGSTFQHMILTNLCAAGGDSGGPLFSGSTAYGITSTATGASVDSNHVVHCTPQAASWYSPVTTALNTYGLHVY